MVILRHNLICLFQRSSTQTHRTPNEISHAHDHRLQRSFTGTDAFCFGFQMQDLSNTEGKTSFRNPIIGTEPWSCPVFTQQSNSYFIITTPCCNFRRGKKVLILHLFQVVTLPRKHRVHQHLFLRMSFKKLSLHSRSCNVWHSLQVAKSLVLVGGLLPCIDFLLYSMCSNVFFPGICFEGTPPDF